ncbi:putative dehydrogenase [Arthrobacter pigmenti]|uniref:Putative dehydrogenase n=1 Tax=Arthrobacter pigmenti TaxID=271432 RepID=A0A846RPW3_9MICC|nr:gfo/Idh/MocA family oxidoreductase [Arthrobacter pigmenti]NJC21146.1 putative dehydrogenase [Arthrobacter pigmenti]
MSLPSSGGVRFGLVGVDSAHSTQFTQLFKEGRVTGGDIVAAWKAPTSLDFPPSRDRNDVLAAQVAEFGVEFVDTPVALADLCDAFLVIASDARTHPALFGRLAPFGKPVYVDTRFALKRSDAETMLTTARTHGCLALAGSPKRFTPEFRSVLDHGRVERIELEGALPTQPGHPGLAWYGVHLVDLAVAALGPGYSEVEVLAPGRVRLLWPDGREALLSGEPEWNPYTRGVVHVDGAQHSFEIEAAGSMHVGLLTSIIESCRTGEPNVPEQEILDIVSIVESTG